MQREEGFFPDSRLWDNKKPQLYNLWFMFHLCDTVSGMTSDL